MSKEEIVITLQKVSKSYHPQTGEVSVLKDLDFVACKGTSVAITGPSGSGKTTLINLLASLDEADSGTVEVLGEVGLVFQQHYLLPQCTAIENVLLPTLPRACDPETMRERAVALLLEMDLGDRMNHFPAQLSGGECQRVALARALVNDPPIIVADEPTGSLNKEQSKAIVELLLKFVEKGKTLITVTHADYVANAMSRRLSLLDGKLSGEAK